MDIFVANYNNLKLDIEYEKYLKYLSYEENEKVDNYIKKEDKARFVLGRLLIKGLAYKNIGSKVSIVKNSFGKPYLQNVNNFHFNISHSHDYVAIVIGKYDVGIDIEYIKNIDFNLYKNVLNEKEINMINSSLKPLEKFYELWTIKECFSKEEGIGLSILDEKYSIDYNNNIIKYKDKKLNFRTFDLEKYKISICSIAIEDDIKLKILNEKEVIELINYIRKEQ